MLRSVGLGRSWSNWPAAIFAVLSLLVAAQPSFAQDLKNYTRSDLDAWLSKSAGFKPDFKAGEVLTIKDYPRLVLAVAPGLIQQLKFPDLRMEIVAPRDHTQRADFLGCTEKYQSQVRLNPDGTMANYICGQPFSDSALVDGDEASGMKAAWNFTYRWQNYGQFLLNAMGIFDKFGGNHSQTKVIVETPPPDWASGVQLVSTMPTDVTADYKGGGTFERLLQSFYERTYFSHLAPRADQGGLLNVPAAKDFTFKEFSGFISPYDVRGEVFITYRYSDPNRADDAWAYDPKLRRVRRISIEVKSDSFAGSDQTIEDFYTFSGRELQWKWKFIGFRDLLCVADSKSNSEHWYGPNGNIFDDVWSVRRFAVIERTPKAPNHPYRSVVMFWDAQTWTPWMALAFSRDQKLYKVWMISGKYSEDYQTFAEINHGLHVETFFSEVVSDIKNDRATIYCDYGNGNPTVSDDHIKRIYDIDKLEEAHR